MSEKMSEIKENKKETFQRIKKAILGFTAFLLFTVYPGNPNPVQPAMGYGGAVNWSYITSIVEGAASILPSFVTLIVNAVPILIILAVVGFVIGFFDSILSAIGSAGRMFR